ncbi:MAG: Aminotransferase class V-fold PLP-dependent enzyme [uncultured Sulfurovum sp.]|uniref:Aminotransferase class V-fold PLP-dependent enzyme n=1 Tax=uncultured Sulfurovum sp. TaxID=269237 RepID=A0A6S6SR91_9BACT|nr:MAG: Aminotransferase class V-fold PLP-dependent enzyme [uncultured Sulfurovum sp.]
MKNIIIKKATPKDFEEIFKFNYQIFTEEIGQYAKNREGMKIDKFHDKNHYFIAVKDLKVIGLLAIHCQSPYSVEEKCEDFYGTIKKDSNIVEIRLFSVSKEYRKSFLSWRLVAQAIDYLLKKEIDYIVVSAIEKQVSLYQKLGFSIFAEGKQEGKAIFYPMFASFNHIIQNRFIQKCKKELTNA